MGDDKMFESITVRELYELVFNADHIEKDNIEYVELQGWIRTNRNNGSVGFIELNDGTYFKSAQLVYSKENKDFEEYTKYGTGCAVTVLGRFLLTPENKQPFEIQVKELVLDNSDNIVLKLFSSFSSSNMTHLRNSLNPASAVSFPFSIFLFCQKI